MTAVIQESSPVWLPRAVEAMASVFHFGGEVRGRLLADNRMKNVWRTLLSQTVISTALDATRGFQRLKSWDISELDFSIQEVACAAVFAYAANELSSERQVWTRTEFDKFSARLRDAAEMCEIVKSYRPPSPDVAHALSVARSHLETIAEEIDDRDSPYTIGRRRDDDEARVRVRAMATETRRLYGTTLSGTVATIVTVALAIEPPVTEGKVRDYCVGLTP